MSMKLVKFSELDYALIVSKGNIPSFVKTVVPVPFSDGNEIMIACVDHHDPTVLKLFLKNCQAIERGYDLDELVSEAYKKHAVNDDKLTLDEQIQRSGGFHVGYKEGAKAMLQILGDKKFTEDDMIDCFYEGKDGDWGSAGGYVDSLQQNEWAVEIVMDEEKEFIFDPAMGISQGHYLDKPKYDPQGRIILRRK